MKQEIILVIQCMYLRTKADGNVVTSEFLAPGKYVLIEKAVVGNYTIDPTPH